MKTAQTINMVEPKKSEAMTTESCHRCGGSGHFSYCQMHGTTCFQCGGTGRVRVKVSTLQNRLKRDAAIIRQRLRNGGLTNSEMVKKTLYETKLEAQRNLNGGLTDQEVREMIEFSIRWHKDQARRVSQWIGEVGHTITCRIKVTYLKWCATEFGSSLLWIGVDPGGNKVKGFSSGKAGHLLAELLGCDVNLTGKVKSLDEYQGEKSTVLTRVKIHE